MREEPRQTSDTNSPNPDVPGYSPARIARNRHNRTVNEEQEGSYIPARNLGWVFEADSRCCFAKDRCVCGCGSVRRGVGGPPKKLISDNGKQFAAKFFDIEYRRELGPFLTEQLTHDSQRSTRWDKPKETRQISSSVTRTHDHNDTTIDNGRIRSEKSIPLLEKTLITHRDHRVLDRTLNLDRDAPAMSRRCTGCGK